MKINENPIEYTSRNHRINIEKKKNEIKRKPLQNANELRKDEKKKKEKIANIYDYEGKMKKVQMPWIRVNNNRVQMFKVNKQTN